MKRLIDRMLQKLFKPKDNDVYHVDMHNRVKVSCANVVEFNEAIGTYLEYGTMPVLEQHYVTLSDWIVDPEGYMLNKNMVLIGLHKTHTELIINLRDVEETIKQSEDFEVYNRAIRDRGNLAQIMETLRNIARLGQSDV